MKEEKKVLTHQVVVVFSFLPYLIFFLARTLTVATDSRTVRQVLIFCLLNGQYWCQLVFCKSVPDKAYHFLTKQTIIVRENIYFR